MVMTVPLHGTSTGSIPVEVKTYISNINIILFIIIYLGRSFM